MLKRWSKSRYAEICRENIHKDWKLALPVLEGLLEKGVFDEASAIAEKALQRLLDLPENEIWDPTKELLICHPQPYLFSRSEDASARLFELWSRAAGGLGRNELSAALDLQAIMVTKWTDWDTVFSKLEKTSSSGFVALVDRFFVQWKNFAAARTEKFIPDNDWHVEWSWVSILADEAREKRRSSKRFHKAMRDWLKEAE